MFSKCVETAPYECYRLWVRLLRHRQTLCKTHDCFNFDKCLKKYLRYVSEGEIDDAEPPANAILVSPAEFVKYFVKHIDESF